MSRKSLVPDKRAVPVRIEEPETVAREVDQMHEKVQSRAFEVFSNGGRGLELDNWLAAERELLWQPMVELREMDHVYTVEAAIAGVDPRQLAVEVTPTHVLIEGETRSEREETRGTVHLSEFSSGSIFRRVAFPEAVDTDGVEAVYQDGLLRLTAPIAGENGAMAPNGQPAAG